MFWFVLLLKYLRDFFNNLDTYCLDIHLFARKTPLSWVIYFWINLNSKAEDTKNEVTPVIKVLQMINSNYWNNTPSAVVYYG